MRRLWVSAKLTTTEKTSHLPVARFHHVSHILMILKEKHTHVNVILSLPVGQFQLSIPTGIPSQSNPLSLSYFISPFFSTQCPGSFFFLKITDKHLARQSTLTEQ